ncbi:hypothetical protein PV11_03347 [Exophiala sideris]|uniref:F-box domain-containing protein n=1 Tax=Exophiala sideris TaxID=1016849 RepID=A0A0D1YYX1_9EURO|nr:hypothetical protein PV11_03347 [Exophiala sideris]
MPLQSREIITLRLILDCEEEEEIANDTPPTTSHLLRLPVEIRLKIVRYLLRIDRNRKSHTRRAHPRTISELLRLDPRRILEAAPFRHRGNQEIDGFPPFINTCHLDVAILKTCKKLYCEGKTVLYAENKVVALQSGIKGLGAKFRNYGITVWGPLPPTRLSSGELESSSSTFEPVMLFSGQNVKPSTPVYICSYKDAADFVHALWIMNKGTFAHGMRYNLTISALPRYKHANRTDSFVKFAILPWLHRKINSVEFHSLPGSKGKASATKGVTEERLESIRLELNKHKTASSTDANLHAYSAICAYLEQIMAHADVCVSQANYLGAELLYERVCFEASSMVRTRTGELVDVSAKSNHGINRVCKLIALSSYRLCELRSDSLTRIALPPAPVLHPMRKVSMDYPKQVGEGTSVLFGNLPLRLELPANPTTPTTPATAGTPVTPITPTSPSIPNVDPEQKSNHEESIDKQSRDSPDPHHITETLLRHQATISHVPRTTRLEPKLARELAITSGLLALRLPCATPLPEWNIRLEIMLLRLFAERNDALNGAYSIRRIRGNCDIAWKEAKEKGKAMLPQWQALADLSADLLKPVQRGSNKETLFEVADRCQRVVTALWGPRLKPKKGYTGLIWTFRWAMQ